MSLISGLVVAQYTNTIIEFANFEDPNIFVENSENWVLDISVTNIDIWDICKSFEGLKKNDCHGFCSSQNSLVSGERVKDTSRTKK